ncbi:phage major capsid protein, P2 family [Azonexus hydrophilus]|uniref:Phage major capsid protein, P2 family n=1 Tax=Azonexus hydrophilus TaxID=418702 RepID=A0ABZ2XD63_9RHOO
MRNETRLAFNAFKAAIAQLNGVPDVTEKFSVAPSVQQKLEGHIQESSDFLSRINNFGVTEQSGEKIGLGIGSSIASTTDTTSQDRVPTDPTSLDKQGYTCTQTNFDTAIKYAKLDAWAKFPNFQTMIRDQIIRRQSLDIITIGFNGTSRAATSNRATNPLLQDVNKGWLQKMRENASGARVLSQIGSTGKIVIGDGATAATGYKNLDALVFDIVNNLIDPWYQEDTELVAIMGRALLADKYFPLINKVQDNSEKMAADVIVSQKRVGGLPAARVPNFPANAILVTRFDNLSRYFQDGARRRTIIDNAKRDQIENYESSNDAYVVEDYGLAALAENIEIAA